MWMTSHEAEELQREIRVQKDNNLMAQCEIGRLRSKAGHLQEQIEQLKAELEGAHGNILRNESLRQEIEQCRDATAQELQELKDAIARTIIKLPGGNEVTVEEARGMVLAHEKLQGS